jgi:hypothetical protein
VSCMRGRYRDAHRRGVGIQAPTQRSIFLGVNREHLTRVVRVAVGAETRKGEVDFAARRPRQSHCNVGYSHQKRHRSGYRRDRDRNPGNTEGIWVEMTAISAVVQSRP